MDLRRGLAAHRAMAALPRLTHDQGMSLGTRVPVAVELGTAADLRRAIGVLAPAALLFAVAAWPRRSSSPTHRWPGLRIVLMAAAASFAHLLAIARSGTRPAAAVLLTVLMLILPIILASVQPAFIVYPVVPLLGVGFALLFLEGRRLAGLMVLASLSSAATTAVQSLAPRVVSLPSWFFVTFNVLGLLACVAVFLILLAAFSGRHRRALRDAAVATSALAHQATHDSLTGLSNRRGVLNRLQGILDGPLADRAKAAVLYIDVDEFKLINDTLGHLAGDELLERVAKRIAGAATADATARPGGDEFVVVLEGLADDESGRPGRGRHHGYARCPIHRPRSERSAHREHRHRPARRYHQCRRGARPCRCRDVLGQAGRQRPDCDVPAGDDRRAPGTTRARGRAAVTRSRPASFASSTSRSSIWLPAGSSSSKRCCAGTIRRESTSGRPSSSRSPRSPDSS